MPSFDRTKCGECVHRESRDGTCRRFPPVVVSQERGYERAEFGWPKVLPDDLGCSEFYRRPKQDYNG